MLSALSLYVCTSQALKHRFCPSLAAVRKYGIIKKIHQWYDKKRRMSLLNHIEECLVCGKPLVYTNEAKEMECAVCGKKALSEASCVDGHFVCDDCHSSGVDLIKVICLNSKSKNPYRLALH
jgi:predicted RNA-binding Zn-ribbon protein involved in translation (DUF1610 family)